MKDCVFVIRLFFYIVCLLGFFGDKCNMECVYLWYGVLCGFFCMDYLNNCFKVDCYFVLGC